MSKNHLSPKLRIFIFLISVFFTITGAVFLYKKSPNSLNIQIAPEQETVIRYSSQTILIDTPFATALPIKEPIFPDRICSIADFGAITGGKTINTEAFKKAIEFCANSGGGKVIVPPGTWLTGPIHLKNNIELQIDRDATVLFSTNFKDYLPVVFSRFEGIEYYNYSPPVYAENCTNVAITGGGTLEGQGNISWWKMKDRATASINKLYALGDDNVPLSERVFGTETAGLRPSFIEFINCANVLVENIKISNGPMWTIHPVYSTNVIIRGVDIETSPGPSTDGIVVDSSSHVLIENSTFNTGDDAIALKSGRDKEGIRLHRPTENVVIRNCNIKDAHGAIAIGSEMSGDVRNVFATDININTAQFGFRVKATTGRGGIVENIWMQNFVIHHTSVEAIQISTAYGFPFRMDSTALPVFRNISVKNILVDKTSQAINIDGLPEQPISDISFEDITLATRLGIELRDTGNIQFKNIQATLKDDDPLFTIFDSAHIIIDNTQCQIHTPICLLLQGNKSEDINVQNSSFTKQNVKTTKDVKVDAIVY